VSKASIVRFRIWIFLLNFVEFYVILLVLDVFWDEIGVIKAATAQRNK
jgi:hypothetical protein